MKKKRVEDHTAQNDEERLYSSPISVRIKENELFTWWQCAIGWVRLGRQHLYSSTDTKAGMVKQQLHFLISSVTSTENKRQSPMVVLSGFSVDHDHTKLLLSKSIEARLSRSRAILQSRNETFYAKRECPTGVMIRLWRFERWIRCPLRLLISLAAASASREKSSLAPIAQVWE